MRRITKGWLDLKKFCDELPVGVLILPIEDGESIPPVGRLRNMIERDNLARSPRRLWWPTRSQFSSLARTTAYNGNRRKWRCRLVAYGNRSTVGSGMVGIWPNRAAVVSSKMSA
jgi:hypothetical protein